MPQTTRIYTDAVPSRVEGFTRTDLGLSLVGLVLSLLPRISVRDELQQESMLAPYKTGSCHNLVRSHCEADRRTCSELVEPRQSLHDYQRLTKRFFTYPPNFPRSESKKAFRVFSYNFHIQLSFPGLTGASFSPVSAGFLPAKSAILGAVSHFLIAPSKSLMYDQSTLPGIHFGDSAGLNAPATSTAVNLYPLIWQTGSNSLSSFSPISSSLFASPMSSIYQTDLLSSPGSILCPVR